MTERLKVGDTVRIAFAPFAGMVADYGTIVEFLDGDRVIVNVGPVSDPWRELEFNRYDLSVKEETES